MPCTSGHIDKYIFIDMYTHTHTHTQTFTFTPHTNKKNFIPQTNKKNFVLQTQKMHFVPHFAPHDVPRKKTLRITHKNKLCPTHTQNLYLFLTHKQKKLHPPQTNKKNFVLYTKKYTFTPHLAPTLSPTPCTTP